MLVSAPVKNTVLCDWLSFTVFDVCMSQFCKDIGLTGFLECPAPKFGYNKMFQIQDQAILVLYHTEREDMGLHFSVSGSGLLYFLQHFYMSQHSGFFDVDEQAVLREFFDYLSSYTCKITRIDLAYDVVDGISVYDVYDRIDRKLIYSPWQSFNCVKNMRGRGLTVYCGSRRSNTFCRIYDKSAEQDLEDNVLWSRFEFELKESSAVSVVKQVLDGCSLESIFLGFCQNYLRLMDDNMCWEWDVWRDFCHTISDKGNYRKLSNDKVSSDSIENKRYWIINQVLPSLYKVLDFDENFDFLIDIFNGYIVRNDICEAVI